MFEVLPIYDVADLQGRLIATWSGLQQHVIDEAIDQWRGRLRKIVASFYKVQCEHMERAVVGCARVLVSNSLRLVCAKKWAKSVDVWQKYQKNKKGDVFIEHSVELT